EIVQRGHNRQTADKLGDETEFQQIFRLYFAQHFTGATFIRAAHIRAKADRGTTSAPRADDLLQPRESTAADKEDVGGIHLQEFLLRMLATALRRHRRNSTFHDLQQSLLDTLAGNVPGNRGIVRLPADLIDFIDIDDSALRTLDIVIGRLQQ